MTTTSHRALGRPAILVRDGLRVSVVARHTFVLASSARPQAAGDSAGAAVDVCVRKPFDLDLLLQQVRLLVRRAAGASSLRASA